MNIGSGHLISTMTGQVAVLVVFVSLLSGVRNEQADVNINRIRLGGQEGASEGQVQILLDNGQWTTLCITNFRFNAAIVICRQLGFPAADRILTISRSINSYPIADFSFSCKESGSLLQNCTNVPTECSANVTAGAKCYRKVNSIRLGEEEGASEGQVEMLFNDGQRRTLCISNFAINALIVMCRQLGFLGANKINSLPRFTNSTYPRADISFSCKGSENVLNECNFVSTHCSRGATAAAKCYSQESGYLGCFQYSTDNRPWDHLPSLQANNMTIGRCKRFCQMRGYTYYGLVNGDQCHCQNVSVKRRQWDDSRCEVVCSGDKYTNCGGPFSMALFEVSQEIPSQSSTAETTWQSTSTLYALTLTSEGSEATPRADGQVVPITTGEASTTADQEDMSFMTGVAPMDTPAGTGVVIGASIICTLVVLLVIIVVLLHRKRQKRHSSRRGRAGEAIDIRQRSSDGLTQNPDAASSQLFDRSEAANTYELVDRPDITSASPKDLLLTDGPLVKQESAVSKQSQHDKAALSIGELYAMPMKEGKKSRKVDTYDMIDENPTADGNAKRYEDVSIRHGGSGSVDTSRRNTASSEMNDLLPTERDTAPLVGEKASRSASTAGVKEIFYEAIDDVFTSTQPPQIYEDVHYDDIPNGKDFTTSGELTPSGGKLAVFRGTTTAVDVPKAVPAGDCTKVDKFCTKKAQHLLDFRPEYDSYESVDCNPKEPSMSEGARQAKKSNSNRSIDCPTYAVPMKGQRTVGRKDSFDDSCMVMNEIYSSCSA